MVPREIFLNNKGKPQRALPRVVRNRVAYKVDARLARHLGNYGRFPHARGAKHNNRALHVMRYTR